MANVTTLLSRPARRPVARAVEGQEIALILVLLALWTALSLGTDTFLTASNLSNLLYSVAPVALIGHRDDGRHRHRGHRRLGRQRRGRRHGRGGQADPRRGCADCRRPSWSRWPIGLVLGAVNGALISFGGIHPIIVTFGTLNLYRFLALRLFENKQVSGVPGTLSFFGGGGSSETARRPQRLVAHHGRRGADVVLLAVLGHRAALVRHRQRRGAPPGSPASGSTAGPSRPTPSPGSSSGSPAWSSSAPAAWSQQNAGNGLELRVIAAVVIGGTSILGGRGTVLGTLLGALLVGTVTSAITLLGWPSDATELFIGLFILVAVGVDLVRERRRSTR